MNAALLVHVALLLGVPPFLPGVIAKTKAWFAGRQGPPLLQPWRDIAKLLRKGAVFSRTTSWVFGAGPVVSLASLLLAGLLTPLAGSRAPLGFVGDVILFAYLMALARFFTAAAALDTGSSFEGLGASREVAFAALAEPTLFLALAIACLPGRTPSFESAWSALAAASSTLGRAPFLAVGVALFAVYLTENARLPVDDPNTHLELTMIHEVMVLDHGGPDLALILYGGAVKLFVLGSVLLHLVAPFRGAHLWQDVAWLLAGQLALAVLVGVVESIMARLRLPRVPQFLIGAFAIAAIGLAAASYRVPR